MTTAGELYPNVLRLDNTKRSTAATCLRKYYWAHERHIKPRHGSSALRYGVVWHATMDAFYTHIQENGWRKDGKALEIAALTARVEWAEYSRKQVFYDDYRSLGNLMIALLRYMDHFASDESMLEIIASENLFEIPMYPETEEETVTCYNPPLPSQDGIEDPFFIFTGMIDLEVMLNGEPWIIDHKTTGKPVQMVANQLRNSPQFIGYTFAASKELAIKPNGFLVVIAHISAYKSKTTQLYGNPKIDFMRNPELYTDDDVGEWRLGIFDTARQVMRCKRTNVWPKRFDSCHTFGTCEFNGLCSQQRPKEDVLFGEDYFVDDPWDIIAETKIREERRKAILSGKIKL